jgi:Coenzyme PQQ synthesis protein D (PqqD)
VVLKLRTDGVQWQEVEGEVVALVGDTSTYVSTNPTGSALWRSLAAGTTTEELVAELVLAYGVDPMVAAGDVASFVDSLRTQHLLEE